MIIKGISASFPSRKVTNDEVVELIQFHSPGYEDDLNQLGRIVRVLLDKSGLVTRNWSAPHESPMDHAAKAIVASLEEADLKASEVELFIYVGIGRGFLEPGNSYMIAKALGFNKAECFDVIDACMSWTRAMSLVDSLFKTGKYRNAMIVNAEFNMRDGGHLYPANFQLTRKTQLEHIMPSFTIGEAATATLVVADEPDNFSFGFHSRPDLSDLCTIPMAGYEGFCNPTEKIGKNGPMQFTSYGNHLHHEGDREADYVFNKFVKNANAIDIVFTHASSKAAWSAGGERMGVAEKIYHIYQHTGNLVSASVPAAISLAKDHEKLKRNDRALCWVGSAGMSFCACEFTY